MCWACGNNCRNIREREALIGIAMRKMGLTEAHYLSPLTKDDGRE